MASMRLSELNDFCLPTPCCSPLSNLCLTGRWLLLTRRMAGAATLMRSAEIEVMEWKGNGEALDSSGQILTDLLSQGSYT